MKREAFKMFLKPGFEKEYEKRHATIATTFSATNGVTDSAAAGTALATGNKTKNGALGVKKDLETKVNMSKPAKQVQLQPTTCP